MFTALWRVLPGALWLKIVIFALVIIALIAALMLFVFPWVDSFFTDPTLEGTE